MRLLQRAVFSEVAEDGADHVGFFDAGDDPRRTAAVDAVDADIVMLERHPLGSQAFVPLQGVRYIVVVAEHPEAQVQAFLADAGQGVNYRPGVWHHPLIALDQTSDFLVIDRAGPGANCDEIVLAKGWVIADSAARA